MAEACELCGGSGWVVAEKDGFSGAERCQCYGKRRTEALQNKSGIPPKFEHVSFETFRIASENRYQNQALSEAYRHTRSFAAQYPLAGKQGLLFIGPPGTGKTHLAVAALKALIAKGFEGVYFDYQTLIKSVADSWTAEATSSNRGILRQAMDQDIVLLDDLGAQRALEWVEDTVTAIITHRYNHNKPLIATTNLPDPILSKQEDPGKPRMTRWLSEVIGERSRSRLIEMCRIIDLTGVEDKRLRDHSRS